MGRYQIAPGENGNVWRLDTATGELLECAMSAQMAPYVTCIGVTQIIKDPRAVVRKDPCPAGNAFNKFDPDCTNAAAGQVK